MIDVADLWSSTDEAVWTRALERYWDFVLAKNLELEKAMEALDLDRIRLMDAGQWYAFLKDEYFRWKYTAANRLATTTGHLIRFVETSLGELYHIKERLLGIDPRNITDGLSVAGEIPGLGTAGASGLLSLMYPSSFATVDQFVVKALRDIPGLPEADVLRRMNPEGLTRKDGVALIKILQRKAMELNSAFSSDTWAPRKIDKILWTYGR